MTNWEYMKSVFLIVVIFSITFEMFTAVMYVLWLLYN